MLPVDVRAPLIAHVVFRFDYGGLENGIVNLVNRMPSNRYRHAIVCLAGFNPDFRARLQRPDVEIVSIGKRPGKDFPAYARMWRVLRRLRPAVVHTRNLATMDMQWAAAAAGIRHRVHGEHGWSPTDPRGGSPGNLRLRRACRPVIQRYVAMSRDIEHWLATCVGAPPGRIRQIYNGVDGARFRPDGARPDDLPWQHDAVAPFVIGTVGRLDPIKDHARLIRAFAEIRSRNGRARPLRLVVAGDGPTRNSLDRLTAELGLQDVVWRPGARADTPELLRALDLFVLPSLNEGISNTLLEAMATGLPVVAGRVGGNPEVVVEGFTGSLYDSIAPGALEAAILRYIGDADLRRIHGASARERAVRHFSLESMVQGYLALYDELLSIPSPAPAGEGQGEGS